MCATQTTSDQAVDVRSAESTIPLLTVLRQARRQALSVEREVINDQHRHVGLTVGGHRLSAVFPVNILMTENVPKVYTRCQVMVRQLAPGSLRGSSGPRLPATRSLPMSQLRFA